MTLLAPGRLWLLIIGLGLAVAYAALQRRSRHKAVRHPDVGLVASVSPRFAGWRRHLTAALLLLAIAALVVGLARPAQSRQEPRDEADIMLAIDLSASMKATDVQPSRLRAAVAAAKRYVAGSPDAYRIGLVGFDARPVTLATPSTDRAKLLGELDSLNRRDLKRGTAAGEGLFTALQVLDASAGDDATVIESDKPYRAVVLLADGASGDGRSLDSAARSAADRHVPVFTVAYGTPSGVVDVDGKPIPVPADPAALAAVADATGGAAYAATSGDELRAVYDRIGTNIAHVTKSVELTVVPAAVAALLLAISIISAMVWSPRLV